jgi:hypothetical protein
VSTIRLVFLLTELRRPQREKELKKAVKEKRERKYYKDLS